MGAQTGILRSLVSGVADSVYELSGRLLTTVTAAYVAGGATLTVDGTHRWPSSGRIAVGGTTGFFSGTTATSLTGLTDEDGNVGLLVDVRAGAVVMDISRATTDLDDLRTAFIADLAVGADLTTLGRNYGVARPRGMNDTDYRGLVRAMAFMRKQTIHACTKVLDEVVGPGNYTLYEDLVSDPLVVHVILAAAPSTQFRGKSYLVGGEAQPQTGAFTVLVDYVPTVIYGIYADSDPFRVGANYAHRLIGGFTSVVEPTWYQTAAPTFTPAMEGRPCYLGAVYGHWYIVSYIDPLSVQLGWPQRNDGEVRTWEPDVLETDAVWFPEWVEGHRIAISGGLAGNNGVYVISEWLSKRRVRLAGAAFVTETDVTWELRPVFGAVAVVPGEIPDATNVAKVITAPQALPALMLIDYTTVPSAQAQADPGVDGNTAYPLYLFDQGAIIAALLDLVTAAGVQVVIETE